jgi:hypothetical protein
MMMKCRFLSWALLTTAAAGALFFGGCSTPESRISDHRDLYDSLPARQQQLVAQGQIAGGMSRNAVWLAWGAPEQRVNGYARGNTTENWVYYTTTTYPYGYGYGYGYGGFGYGPYGYGYPGFWGGGVGVFRTHHGRRFAVFGDPFYDPFFYSYWPTVTYPYKTVTFVNGRVVEFQRMVGYGYG